MVDIQKVKKLVWEADAHLCTQSLILDRDYIHDRLVDALYLLSEDD